ncbi:hypothetical protein [Actinoplanes lobatus]|nr:hypothetical protein [Actinoplanes lobatus]MBB4751663.1 hypothetical protein [Actinoplanes lobatus]
MLTEAMRRLLWRRRARAARAWRDAERHQAAERSEAIRRILDYGAGHCLAEQSPAGPQP